MLSGGRLLGLDRLAEEGVDHGGELLAKAKLCLPNRWEAGHSLVAEHHKDPLSRLPQLESKCHAVLLLAVHLCIENSQVDGVGVGVVLCSPHLTEGDHRDVTLCLEELLHPLPPGFVIAHVDYRSQATPSHEKEP